MRITAPRRQRLRLQRFRCLTVRKCGLRIAAQSRLITWVKTPTKATHSALKPYATRRNGLLSPESTGIARDCVLPRRPQKAGYAPVACKRLRECDRTRKNRGTGVAGPPPSYDAYGGEVAATSRPFKHLAPDEGWQEPRTASVQFRFSATAQAHSVPKDHRLQLAGGNAKTIPGRTIPRKAIPRQRRIGSSPRRTHSNDLADGTGASASHLQN